MATNKLGFRLPARDDEDLIAWLQRKVDIGRSVLPESQMKLNLAFFLGEQWLVPDESKRSFRRPQHDPHSPDAPVRITVNKIGGLVERTVAKLTKNAPIPEARPVSDDDQDVSAARVATRILTHEMERLKWRDWLVDFLFWPAVLGHSYAMVSWDPDLGEVVGEDEEGELHEGQITLDMVPAFELAVDPNAIIGMLDAKWAVRSTSMTPEAVWERWDVEVEAQEGARSLAQEVLDMAVEGAHTSSEWVMVHSLWIVPSKAAPKGAVITWTGDQVLEYKDEYPFDHKRLPFVEEDLLPGLGRREGRTWVNDLIPMQVDYNDARSREAKMRRTVSPKVFASRGSGLDGNRMGSQMEVWEYNPTGAEPKVYLPSSTFMDQHEVAMNRSDMEMGERAGQGDVSQGNAPAGTPAAAILALQEADDTKLAVSATQLAAFTAEVGWHILMLARQFWTEERTIRVWSEENVLEAYRYIGSDIASKFDVHVTPESALPRSKSARVQLLLELQARMPDLFDPQTLIRALDLPGVDFIVRSIDLDVRKQQRELGKLISGEDCPVDAWDNHLVHLKQINNFRKTLDYEQLDDAGKARVDAHAAVHESLVLRQMGVAVPEPVPPVPGALAEAEMVGAGVGEGAVPQGPQYLDPLTGLPPDPTAVASGQTPSALTDSQVARRAGIGQAAGQPGRVPGVSADNQAASMGE